MPTSVEVGEALAVDVSCSDDALTVVLDDGRRVSVPLAWFPRLVAATPKQRKQWEMIGPGIGIHWEAVDEDISVASLLQPEKFMPMTSGMRPARRSARRPKPRPRSNGRRPRNRV